MKREWEPGDVAMIMVDGTERIAVRSEGGGWVVAPNPSASRRVAESARPLVVIDPESDADIARLENALEDQGCRVGVGVQAALREFANPTPPRIDEPGTWGVVEASCVHGDVRSEWIHHPDGNWWPAFAYSKVPERTPLPDDWDSLIDPVLVREGVTQ